MRMNIGRGGLASWLEVRSEADWGLGIEDGGGSWMTDDGLAGIRHDWSERWVEVGLLSLIAKSQTELTEAD